MELQLNNSSKKVSVADNVFDVDYNQGLVHQVVVSYLAGARAGTKAQKNRSDASGGGAKPWRQKGTGRARAGTIRSPLWRGGGVTFAARPKDHSVKVNRKMYRAAIRSILSELSRQSRLIVIDDIAVDKPNTKQLVARLKEIGVENTLILTETADENLYLSARNLSRVDVTDMAGVSPVELLRYENVVITVGSVRAIEEWLS